MSEPSKSNAPLSPIKQALVEIRDLREKVARLERAKAEPIAVVGMGFRFPGGVSDPASFWQVLRDGVDAIGDVPADRWDAKAYFDEDRSAPGKMYTTQGGFLSDIDRFDADFFGIAPREADLLDPQHRLLLEVSWEALERAGLASDRLMKSRTGVFLGMGNSDYGRRAFSDPAGVDMYAATGNCYSVAAGRLSYLLGLQGPSMVIDTACSSSLVALHLAVQSLRAQESDLALAGGVNLILSPEININFCKAGMLAPDGRCKTFDAAADGYVRSEGAGVVVLKRLSDAVEQGDPILSVVRGTAINQDGRSGGLTAPSGPSQEAVIRAALADAGVAPDAISYVETHGTGTPLGDPIEVQALGKALREGRSPDASVTIGSVKTNLGHLESAAGVAGLIKVILAFQHEQIPPHLHFETPSSHIPWDELPVHVAAEAEAWPVGDQRRLAGISSFGFSGTNAHVILEEPPALPSEPEGPARPWELLCLSGKTEAARRDLAERYAEYLRTHPEVSLADVGHTTNTGRSPLEYRMAVPARSVDEAREKLEAVARGEWPEDVPVGRFIAGSDPGGVAFLFSGQGAQYPGMGRDLYATQPAFRDVIDRCDEVLQPLLGRTLLDILFAEGDPEQAPIHETRYAQPTTFALQCALAAMWRSWGLVPTVVMGHSLGEFAAACVAGVFSLEDGLKLVYERGRLMESLTGGGMMASLLATEERARAAIAPYAERIAVAAVNGPQSVVLAGEPDAMEEVLNTLEADGVKVKRLHVPFAAHSPQVDQILDRFEQAAQDVTYHAPKLKLVSNVTGRLAGAEVAQAAYWRRHAREPVQFAAGMQALDALGCRTFVEIGPHTTLMGMGQGNLPDEGYAWLPSLREGWLGWQQVVETLGTLYTRGIRIDWDAFSGHRRRIPLPTYPFQRARYWLEAAAPSSQNNLAKRWETVGEEAGLQAKHAPLDLHVASYEDKWNALRELTKHYVIRTLGEFGAFRQAGETHTVQALQEQCGIIPTYEHLVSRWLDLLTEERLLVREGGAYMSPLPLPQNMAQQAQEHARAVFTDDEPLLAYVAACGEKLTAVVTGKESALETLFPGGSYATTEFLYRDWAVARYFNGIARAAVSAAARVQPGQRPLRILEIGAGTGGTTASLLPALKQANAEYCFTDVSDFFLERAQETFAEYPFVRYRLLDIERDPEEQGFPMHGFDVVVAANVLHATRDLDRTMQHVESLLAPGGLVLMYEATHHPEWFDVTTGLIEGWQKFEDGYRSDNPLLAPETWAQVLQANGFAEVRAFPDAGLPTEVLRQHVLVARVAGEATATAAADAFFAEAQSRMESGTHAEASAAPAEGFRQRLDAAIPVEREELLVEYVRDRVAAVLRRTSSQELAPQHRLLDLGVDSLMAVELRNRLSSDLGLERDALPATLVFDYPTIEAIAQRLSDFLWPEPTADPTESAVQAASDTDDQARREADIADRSDEEVEAMLMAKLDGMLSEADPTRRS